MMMMMMMMTVVMMMMMMMIRIMEEDEKSHGQLPRSLLRLSSTFAGDEDICHSYDNDENNA